MEGETRMPSPLKTESWTLAGLTPAAAWSTTEAAGESRWFSDGEYDKNGDERSGKRIRRCGHEKNRAVSRFRLLAEREGQNGMV